MQSQRCIRDPELYERTLNTSVADCVQLEGSAINRRLLIFGHIWCFTASILPNKHWLW